MTRFNLRLIAYTGNRLKRNLFRGRILQFVIGPIVLGVAVFLFFSPTETLGIAIFGTATFIWALYFPFARNPLPQKATDFWYYTLGGIGVILLFVNQSDQRQLLALQQKYDERFPAFVQLENERDRIMSERLNRERVFQRLRRSAERIRWQWIKEECVEPERFGGDLDLFFGPSSYPVFTVYFCKSLEWEPVILDMMESKSIDEFSKILGNYDDHVLDRIVKIDAQLLGLELLPLLVKQISSNPKVAEHLAGVNQDIEDLRQQLDEILDLKYRLGFGSNRSISFALLADLQYHLWPYVLILAFALKLSRVNYFSRDLI